MFDFQVEEGVSTCAHLFSDSGVTYRVRFYAGSVRQFMYLTEK